MIVADGAQIRIQKLELGPFGTNAYIVACRATGESVLVDAPDEPAKIVEALRGTSPQRILITHSHFDHLQALLRLKTDLKIPVAAHDADAGGLPFAPDVYLSQGDTVPCGQLRIKVLHTPGHTPGSLCFLVAPYLLSGDTLFPGGPGKTGSSAAFKQIVGSITGKLFGLPDDTQVHPGHGASTELGREKQAFRRFSSRPHPEGLCGDVLWDGA